MILTSAYKKNEYLSLSFFVVFFLLHKAQSHFYKNKGLKHLFNVFGRFHDWII